MKQIELHKKIDKLVQAGPGDNNSGVVSDLISTNNDSYRYFFSIADEKWLGWLWDNGLLDIIKKKTDSTKLSHQVPELWFLERMAEKEYKKVTDIILEVPVSKKDSNPEIVRVFNRICSILPADQIARIVSKIKREEWIQLVYEFNPWGFDYEEVLKKLNENNDYRSILILAEAILSVRTKKEIEDSKDKPGTDNSFYFNDLGQTKIFKHLSNIDDEFVEDALKLTTEVMGKIVLMGDKTKSKVFEIDEIFSLFDVDFFTLKLDDKRHVSYRDDVKNLAATIKTLIERAIGQKRDNSENAKKLYEKYINSLPFSLSMWRLRLFVLSYFSDVFKKELEEAFFKIFNCEGYHDLIYGAEYHQALKNSFSVLSDDKKREYIGKITDFFGKPNDDEKWHKRRGIKILSCIASELTDDEKTQIGKTLGKIENKFEPEPSITPGIAGMVSAKALIDSDSLGKMSISEIVKKLSTEWTPNNLRKMDKDRDFLNPLNAEGMGSLLKQDIANRTGMYLSDANLFFDRDSLDQHYTYSFLQGISDVFQQGSYKEDVNFEGLVTLIENITESGKEKKFEEDDKRRKELDTWLAGWGPVHSAIADIVKELLGENKKESIVNFLEYRGRLLGVIKYLLSYPDPTLEDNTKENGSDPFTIAINSVRGRSFQTFTLFIYRDGERFSKKDEIKIFEDVKSIYENILDNEDTYAIMFLCGHYLLLFYYRDKKWVLTKIIPKLFPNKKEKLDLYIAAWEGYLAANIYKEMFDDFSGLYKLAINIDPELYTDRKYHRGLDELLADHLALAYVHFDNFNIESELFKLFWNDSNKKRHQEFISFIGRHAISRDDKSQENDINIEKIKKLWDWILENIENKEVFSGFGFWMSDKKNIFTNAEWLADHIHRTLEKSKGEINWDYGLIKSLPVLAEKAPEETLKILEIYLLSKIDTADAHPRLVYIDEFRSAFDTLYKNKSTASGTYNLINELLVRGGSPFWGLKEVVK